MGKVVHTLFPRRISIAKDLNDKLKTKAQGKADSVVPGSRTSNYRWDEPTSAAARVQKYVDDPVNARAIRNVQQFVFDRWSGMTARDTGMSVGHWLNKFSFQAIYHKGDRSLRKMRKYLDNGIWLNLILAALSVVFLAVDGLYLLLRGIWMDGAGTGMAADLAATSLVLAGFFLLLSAACWGARELTVEIVKMRNRNASRLTN